MRACYLMNWNRKETPLEHPIARPVPEGVKEIEAIKKNWGGARNTCKKKKTVRKICPKKLL